jgi:hypothetical protein
MTFRTVTCERKIEHKIGKIREREERKKLTASASETGILRSQKKKKRVQIATC